MITLNFVAQNGHSWQQECQSMDEVKQVVRETVKEHGDIERVEMLTEDGPENIWTMERSKAAAALGKSKSPKKTEAARKNGAKGGWKKGVPRKKKSDSGGAN